MSAEPLPEKRKGITTLEILAAILALVVLGGAFAPFGGCRIQEKSNITKGISNCRQIITALQIYAADHDGNYPDATLTDAKYSNEVFRILFQKSVLDNEMIFGCPVSNFVPDGNTGEAPGFDKAVEAEENHWAMTAGLSDGDSGSIPLVYENPVIATWSPKWNPDAKGTNTRGRAWSNGIIVGMNDSSVSIHPLESKTGTEVTLKDLGEGQSLFGQHQPPSPSKEWKILDVEVNPQ